MKNVLYDLVAIPVAAVLCVMAVVFAYSATACYGLAQWLSRGSRTVNRILENEEYPP